MSKPTTGALWRNRDFLLLWAGQAISSVGTQISGFALLLLLAIFTVLILYSGRSPSPIIRSLAVLPLENLSGDASQDYFSDGMTDALIADLDVDGARLDVAAAVHGTPLEVRGPSGATAASAHSLPFYDPDKKRRTSVG